MRGSKHIEEPVLSADMYIENLINPQANFVRTRLYFLSTSSQSSRCHECAIVLVVNVREVRIRANSACK